MKRWMAIAVLLLWAFAAQAQEASDQATTAEPQRPPVGGLFGLFRRKPKPTPTESEAIEHPTPETIESPAPAPSPPPTELPPPTVSPTLEPTASPTVEPTAEPTVTMAPTETPTIEAAPARKPKKGAKPEAKASPTETPTPEEAAPEEEEKRPPEETPEPEPTEAEGAEGEPSPEAIAPPIGEGGEKATSRGEPSGGRSDVRLPSVEIQGELEKPDIFFVVPRARDQSDEQLMRARIRREITRPVIKDWVEEEMLLK